MCIYHNKKINQVHHFNRIRWKKILSSQQIGEKHLTNLLPIHDKNSQSVMEGNFFNVIKSIYEKLTASIKLKSERLLFSKIRNKAQMCIITKTILESLTTTIKEEQEITHTQIEKEVELHLFTENTIVHIENPKDYQKSC